MSVPQTPKAEYDQTWNVKIKADVQQHLYYLEIYIIGSISVGTSKFEPFHILNIYYRANEVGGGRLLRYKTLSVWLKKISNPEKSDPYTGYPHTEKKSNNFLYRTANLLTHLSLICVLYNPHRKENNMWGILMWEKKL